MGSSSVVLQHIRNQSILEGVCFVWLGIPPLQKESPPCRECIDKHPPIKEIASCRGGPFLRTMPLGEECLLHRGKLCVCV